ncbi:hypothetical protein [Xenorhabdus bovienii]|uniref:hypothetical protein n=1 Tax=Xenorhabdus bovienii TaxID=40576 RepID=UPI0004D6D7D6|nr:hypothetical protein [Xenorhabdus bovienii]CDG86383.1 conserved hypothetical protein [Xenorhabdus bovienii str. feltiae France]CDG93260.1 conserved hypothetical protein [Xenorhabdus bovienii str. feltiae Florida]
MPKHIHADLMMKAVEMAQLKAEWWEYFEVLHDDADRWLSLAGEFYFDPDKEYRLKPRTIRIGSVDVPEPVREPLEEGQDYYFLDLGGESYYDETFWLGDLDDVDRLNRCLIHLDRESAVMHAKALLSLTAK